MNAAAVCAGCAAELGPGLLACLGCGQLVHRDRLIELTRSADAYERAGHASDALGALRSALELLPKNTRQYAAIDARMQTLSAQIDGRDGAKKKHTGALAGLGALGLVLLKSKALLMGLLAHGKLLLVGLTKLPTLLSMLLYARFTRGEGVALALGIVASIYVHEVGHVAALRRYGIAASAPMFVPGFGAFVRMKQYPTSVHEEARTGLAGPLWGLVAALIAFATWYFTGSTIARDVATWGAALNLFNLVPVWQLDGARGLKALDREGRLLVGAAGIVLGVLFHIWLPAIIGGVCMLRAIKRPDPEVEDRHILLLFLALLFAHGFIASLARA